MVFPGKELNDLELLQKNGNKLDKATLGKLVTTLKSRVVLNDGFEKILTQYLTDRNSLVHNWDEVKGWESESRALEFSINFQKQAAYVGYTFLGFMRAWMKQVDFSEVEKRFPELERFWAEIDSKWKPLINEFIEEVKHT